MTLMHVKQKLMMWDCRYKCISCVYG